MKQILALILVCTSAFAGTPEEYAAGQGRLQNLLQNDPLFLLEPTYKGSVSLVYQRGPREKDAPTQREHHFNAFTPDASRDGEPDSPKPKLPAVVEVSPLEGNGFGTGAFAFSESAPAVDRLAACATLEDLRGAVPELIRAFSEDKPRPGYWFNWFSLTDNGQLEIVFLTAGDDAAGKLTSMEVWTGTFSPSK